MFGLHVSPVEIVIRGSFVYLALFTLLRVVVKRESGTTGVTDLLVIVLIADAAQNAMAGEYQSITEGLILVVTILGWSYLLDFLSFKHKRLARIIRPRPLPLVRNGCMIPPNMRRELVTEEELRTQLREQGIDDMARVKAAFMEADGQFSVVTEDKPPARRRSKKAF